MIAPTETVVITAIYSYYFKAFISHHRQSNIKTPCFPLTYFFYSLLETFFMWRNAQTRLANHEKFSQLV